MKHKVGGGEVKSFRDTMFNCKFTCLCFIMLVRRECQTETANPHQKKRPSVSWVLFLSFFFFSFLLLMLLQMSPFPPLCPPPPSPCPAFPVFDGTLRTAGWYTYIWNNRRNLTFVGFKYDLFQSIKYICIESYPRPFRQKKKRFVVISFAHIEWFIYVVLLYSLLSKIWLLKITLLLIFLLTNLDIQQNFRIEMIYLTIILMGELQTCLRKGVMLSSLKYLRTKMLIYRGCVYLEDICNMHPSRLLASDLHWEF